MTDDVIHSAEATRNRPSGCVFRAYSTALFVSLYLLSLMYSLQHPQMASRARSGLRLSVEATARVVST